MEEGGADNPVEEPLSPETMELMQSIVVRHMPRDPHHMRTLMTNAGLQSGAYAMAVGLMWWITVAKGGAQLGDQDIPTSLIGMQFHSISIMVPILVLISAFVFALGSYRGNPALLLAGGATALLVAYLVIEPLGLFLIGPMDEAGVALTATGRLAVLSALTYASTTSGISAILLSWVLGQHHYLPFDVFEMVDDSDEGDDDVSPPFP